MAIQEEGRQEKGLVKDTQVNQFDNKKCLDLDSDDLLKHFSAFGVFLSIKVDEH